MEPTNEIPKEYKDWFRPPQLRLMAPVGDFDRYLWIAEPVRNGGIYGLAYKIPYSDIAVNQEEIAHANAHWKFVEILKGNPTTYREGAMWEVFLPKDTE